MTRHFPRINDITSDRDRPPAFWVKPPTHHAYNALKYRALTEQAYGDLTNLELPVRPADAFARVLELVKERGWRVAAKDDLGRRVQAVAITSLLRFRDDVIVEVRPAPEGGGSTVAMRSKSRLGRGDLGANAQRIREFFADLAAGTVGAPGTAGATGGESPAPRGKAGAR
jgi:uncharacterized protein (DUF1499 family)